MQWLIATLGLAAAQVEPESALTLARALELARAHHQTAAIAQARIEQAEAVRAGALSAFLPEISLVGRYTRQPRRVFDTGDGFPQVIQEENVADGRAALNLTVLDATSFVELARAEPTFEMVKLRAKENERALGFEVARIFLAILSTEQLARAAESRIEVATKAKDDARKRFEQGLAGGNDVTRAEIELETAELAAIDARASVQATRLRLERYVGPAARAPLVAPAELSSPRERSEPSEQALRERPDLLELRAAAESARIAAGEPLWGLVPTLSLDAHYDLTTQQAFTGESQDWGVSLSASWTIFDRGRRYHERDELSAAARAASLELERAMDDAANELARARVQLERAHLAMTRAERRTELSVKNAAEVAVRYREGVASAFELADANAQVFAANAELARARFEVGSSILAVRRSAGDAAWQAH